MSRVCLQCSTQNEETAVYCDYCGAVLPQPAPRPVPMDLPGAVSPSFPRPMNLPGVLAPSAPPPQVSGKLVCGTCGHEAKSGDLFCINCGAALASMPPALPSPPAYPAPASPVPSSPLVASAPPITPVAPVAPSAETYLVKEAAPSPAPVPGAETRVLTSGRLVIGDADIPLPSLLELTLGRQDPYAKPPWHPEVDLTAYGAGDPAYGVSRRHARLRWSGEWTIEDLNSANGTFVGGKRISQRTTIHDGDQIMLGRLVMTFRLE